MEALSADISADACAFPFPFFFLWFCFFLLFGIYLFVRVPVDNRKPVFNIFYQRNLLTRLSFLATFLFDKNINTRYRNLYYRPHSRMAPRNTHRDTSAAGDSDNTRSSHHLSSTTSTNASHTTSNNNTSNSTTTTTATTTSTSTTSRSLNKTKQQQLKQAQEEFLARHINSNGPQDQDPIDPLDFETLPVSVLNKYKKKFGLDVPDAMTDYGQMLGFDGVGSKSWTSRSNAHAQTSQLGTANSHNSSGGQNGRQLLQGHHSQQNGANSNLQQQKQHQHRVTKPQLAAAAKKHFLSHNVKETDAIANFIYTINNEGKTFKLKF